MMEEAELLKERLQAITNKRKIQEDIAQKRLEIDKEKLQLQQLKKRMMRDQWLMDGESMTQQAQRDGQQTKLLQTNIHRLEKEIEAMEREELNISTNEGFILNRLKAIEKSPEDIIKAVIADFKSEPVHDHSAMSNKPKSFTPLSTRKHSALDQESKKDQSKPALFAMEINVQKDMRTGESQVLSTATVSPQELQQRGIKVYDDGRKSVYALRSDGGPQGPKGVNELSPKEVEELLRQATDKRRKSKPSQVHDPMTNPPWQPNTGRRVNGIQEPYGGDVSAGAELMHAESVCYPRDDVQHAIHMTEHQYASRHTERYQSRNGSSCSPVCYDRDLPPPHMTHYAPRESHQAALQVDSKHRQYREHMPHPVDSKPSILNAIPADEPITMIFMGYQTAEDDSQGFEGSVRAELVVIGDGDGDGEDGSPSSHYSSQHQDGHHSQVFHSHQNYSANNSSPYLASGQEPAQTRQRRGEEGKETSSATGARGTSGPDICMSTGQDSRHLVQTPAHKGGQGRQ